MGTDNRSFTVKAKRYDTSKRMLGRALQKRRLAVWAKDPCCAMCRRLTAYPSGYELDHTVPLFKGGADTDVRSGLDEHRAAEGCRQSLPVRQSAGSGDPCPGGRPPLSTATGRRRQPAPKTLPIVLPRRGRRLSLLLTRLLWRKRRGLAPKLLAPEPKLPPLPLPLAPPPPVYLRSAPPSLCCRSRQPGTWHGAQVCLTLLRQCPDRP